MGGRVDGRVRAGGRKGCDGVARRTSREEKRSREEQLDQMGPAYRREPVRVRSEGYVGSMGKG